VDVGVCDGDAPTESVPEIVGVWDAVMELDFVLLPDTVPDFVAVLVFDAEEVGDRDAPVDHDGDEVTELVRVTELVGDDEGGAMNLML